MLKKIIFCATISAFFTAGFCPFNSSYIEKNSFAGEILENGKKLYSAGNEELIIRDFFNDCRDGFFVDIGCSDYKGGSTTYYLEKHLGWSGIAVDALPEFEKGYLENRPKTKYFNFIVTDHSDNIEPFYRLVNDTGYSSTSEDFVTKVAGDKYEKYQKIYVPTITLNELLTKNGISEIDFLSMDIELGEPAALTGFDIIKFKPKLVCIEATSNTEEIMDYFRRRGYKRVGKYLKYDRINTYFKPRE